MTAIKRKGWRKGPSRDGSMRLSRSWRHAKLGLCVAFNVEGWHYYGGKAGNSLWTGQSFRTPLEAMIAAEKACAAAGGGA